VHHAGATLPEIERNGVTLRVIAGSSFGVTSPAVTFSGTLYAAAHFSPGSALALEPEHEERGVYLVDGDLSLDGEPLEAETMAVLAPGETVTLDSTNGATVMLLGGEKLDGERFIEWNFVASSREKIEAAKLAWTNQEMGKVPGESEWIPLPERKPR
jgi:redox-sensitive bicupin YhaK (pirin superfamily)